MGTQWALHRELPSLTCVATKCQKAVQWPPSIASDDGPSKEDMTTSYDIVIAQYDNGIVHEWPRPPLGPNHGVCLVGKQAPCQPLRIFIYMTLRQPNEAACVCTRYGLRLCCLMPLFVAPYDAWRGLASSLR